MTTKDTCVTVENSNYVNTEEDKVTKKQKAFHKRQKTHINFQNLSLNVENKLSAFNSSNNNSLNNTINNNMNSSILSSNSNTVVDINKVQFYFIKNLLKIHRQTIMIYSHLLFRI
jgi:hypothetical protein